MTDKPKAPRFEGRVHPCFCVDSLLLALAVRRDLQITLDRPAERPSLDLRIILDAPSRVIHDLQWCSGVTAEDRIHEYYQGLLQRVLPTPISTDQGAAVRGGRKGSGGDVRRRKSRNA